VASLKRVSGLDQHITRRDFVNGIAIGFGAVLLGGAATGHTQQAALVPAVSPGEDWYGYGGVGDYRLSHGNTPQAMAEAHMTTPRRGTSSDRGTAASHSVTPSLTVCNTGAGRPMKAVAHTLR